MDFDAHKERTWMKIEFILRLRNEFVGGCVKSIDIPIAFQNHS